MAKVNRRQDASRAFGGRYRLLEFLGEGSQARVYEAEDLALRRRVALKLVRADIAERAGFADRFAAEMQATAVLNHPRVLPVYDWGLTPQPYVVTEYLTGGSLGMLTQQGRLLTVSQGLMVGLEAARALQEIHGSGRAHLGLTPAAILFDSSARPYISDLGLAAALAATDLPSNQAAIDAAATVRSDTSDRASATGADSAAVASSASSVSSAENAAVSGTNITSPSYTRAEQSQDVHDLAVVLCEAITGKKNLSLDGSDPLSIAALGPLQTVLEHATAADPIARLTATDFASELLRVAPMLPRPDPLPRAVDEELASAEGIRQADSAETFEQVGPTAAERYAIPLDDVPRRRWPGLLLALLLVLGGAVAGAWVWLNAGSDSAVPELRGLTEADATEAATEAGWKINKILVRASDTARGEIVDTEPQAGGTLSEGDTLDVYVSLGEPLVLVSELRTLYGLTVDEAVAELKNAGFGVAGEVLTDDEVVPAGNVIGLAVAEGVYELEAGSDIALLVSQGPADRQVPEVPPSATLQDATRALTALRLSPRVIIEFSDEVAEGAVIGFLPASGTSVPVDSTVRVRLSQGPMPPPEPEEPVDSDADTNDESAPADS